MSLLGALGPLGKVATKRKSFAMHMLLYYSAGGLASGLIGAALAMLGRAIGAPSLPLSAAALAVTALALMRELGASSIPLPQVRRQTNGKWSPRSYVSTLFWGIDLGLVFSTWLTFAGPWALAAVAVASGDATFGAQLFVCLWTGRALSVWLAPLALKSAAEVPWLVAAVFDHRGLFQKAHALGLSVFLAVVFLGLSSLLRQAQ